MPFDNWKFSTTDRLLRGDKLSASASIRRAPASDVGDALAAATSLAAWVAKLVAYSSRSESSMPSSAVTRLCATFNDSQANGLPGSAA